VAKLQQFSICGMQLRLSACQLISNVLKYQTVNILGLSFEIQKRA